MVVAKLNRPYACTGTDVQDSAWIIADRREIELLAKQDAKHLVCKVEAIEFALCTVRDQLLVRQRRKIWRTSSLGIIYARISLLAPGM